MVLDPISALGLAGNVVQFVEFCGNVVSESRRNYRSTTDTSLENTELESIAEDLRRLTTQLHSSDGDRAISAAGDQELTKLLVSCNEVADELLRAVELLKVKQGPHRKWNSFRQAFLSVLSKDKLARLQSRLAAIREQITLHLVSSIRSVLPYSMFISHSLVLLRPTQARVHLLVSTLIRDFHTPTKDLIDYGNELTQATAMDKTGCS
jgi:hypothetical protein